MKIATTGDLKRIFPDLVKQIEDNILNELGLEKGQRRKSLREDEPLSDEEKSKIRLETKLMAGIH